MAGRLKQWCRWLVVRPLIRGMLGMAVAHAERLPSAGPAILVANHNSHFDTLALLALFPRRMLAALRPVCARDYFQASRPRAWVARRFFGAIPLDRACRPGGGDPLAACSAALKAGEILILFPEGTRGAPGALGELKPGVAHLVQRHPEVPVVPVMLGGLERVLPKRACVPLPLLCTAEIGMPRRWNGDRRSFMAELRAAMLPRNLGSAALARY